MFLYFANILDEIYFDTLMILLMIKIIFNKIAADKSFITFQYVSLYDSFII